MGRGQHQMRMRIHYCRVMVRECREMGEVFGTHFASDIIKKNTTRSLKEMRKIIIKADKKMTIKKCGGENSYDCQSC